MPKLIKFYEDHWAERDRFEILGICIDEEGEPQTKNHGRLIPAVAYEKRWRAIGEVAVRRRAFPESGGRSGSHDGGHTIVAWRGRLSACVCDFRPAWLSPFSLGVSWSLCPLKRWPNGVVTAFLEKTPIGKDPG